MAKRAAAGTTINGWPHDWAMAASQDAANMQMRKGGRKKWSRDDYNHAVATFERLHPLARECRERIEQEG